MNTQFLHPLPDELAEYAARRSAAPDVLRISDHLAECAACHAALAQLRGPSPSRWSGHFVTGATDVTPDFNTLAGEVDGTLSPAEHEDLAAELAHDAAAREALADLAAFRDELAALPVKYHGLGNSPVARPEGSPANNIITPSRWIWRKQVGWAVGLAALFMALAIGAWMFAGPGQDSALLRGSDGQIAVLGGLPPELRQAVETAVQTGQLPPMAATPAVRRGVLAGQVTTRRMTALSPAGSVVREQKPALQWTPCQDATGYLVSIMATDGGGLVTSPVLPADQTRWVPADVLPRGKTFQWQVEALRGETVIDRAPKPPAAEARFEVLDANKDRELVEVEKHNSDRALILGVAYWRAGLAASAEDEFRRLAHSHPESVIAQRLAHAADRATASVAAASASASE